MLLLLFLFLVALISNTLSAFSGGGAGLLQLPALLFLGLPMATALATHKVASVALGIGAAYRYYREKQVERSFVILMLLSGVPGVLLGALVILNIDDRISTFGLALLTLGIGIYSIKKKEMGQHYTPKNTDAKGYVIGGIGLFLTGFLNGSLTSGTGLIATLWLIRWFGMDYKKAVAHTLIMVGIFWNLTGATTLTIARDVNVTWAIPLVIGSLLGGYLGAQLNILKSNALIKKAFEIITLLTGLSLMYKTAIM